MKKHHVALKLYKKIKNKRFSMKKLATLAGVEYAYVEWACKFATKPEHTAYLHEIIKRTPAGSYNKKIVFVTLPDGIIPKPYSKTVNQLLKDRYDDANSN